jgi:serine/threonine protein kinase
MSTEYSRGTNSYRAPELTAEVSTFSNKVDIWSGGCILYELAVRRKAFVDDWTVRQYAEKQKLLVPLEYFVKHIQILLTNMIHEMLQVNPRARPSVQELHAAFTRFLTSPQTPSSDDESSLFSRICQPLSDEIRADLESTTCFQIFSLLTFQEGNTSPVCSKRGSKFTECGGCIGLSCSLRTKSVLHWSK